MLRKLSKEDQDRICSQQVITELRDCIKELVDNAIDAGCTEILISLTDFGSSTIEVLDNGRGIEELSKVGERGATSKLESFHHIHESLSTLGFRGEGLNSIINSSELVEMDSKCSGGQSRLVFEQGKCLLEDGASIFPSEYRFPGRSGTRVRVVGLFLPYASRRLQFLNNLKMQLKSLMLLLEEYAICYPGIRFLLSNKMLSDSEREKVHKRLSGSEIKYHKNQTQSELFMTRGSLSSQKDVAQYIWGKSVLGDSLDFRLEGEIFLPQLQKLPPADPDAEETEERSGPSLPEPLIGGQWTMSGFISSLDKGRPAPDHQIFTVNSRPVDPIKRISRVISSIHSTLSSFSSRKLHPAFVINISLPQSLVDINVTPNKRAIMLPSRVETVLAESIQEFLQDSYQNQIPIKKESSLAPQPRLDLSSQTFLREQIRDPVREQGGISDRPQSWTDSEDGGMSAGPELGREEAPQPAVGKRRRLQVSVREFQPASCPGNEEKGSSVASAEGSLPSSFAGVRKPIKIRLKNSIPVQSVVELRYSKTEQEIIWSQRGLGLVSGLGTRSSKGPTRSSKYLPNLDITRTIHKNERGLLAPSRESKEDHLTSFNFKKHLFGQLQVIGQFNKGFIITKLAEAETEDSGLHIFIIDQHASDEKARFERLNGDPGSVQTQRLISPLAVSLSPSQEQLVISYKDIFEKNGFKFVFDRNSEIGSRIQLVQLPVILGIPLKQLDFMDLLSQLDRFKVRISTGTSWTLTSPGRADTEKEKEVEEEEEEEEDSIVSVSTEDQEKDGTTLWCPSGLVPRPRKVWSILAS
ncbi:PMS1'MutL-like ATPase', partial [Cryptosporidium canis]